MKTIILLILFAASVLISGCALDTFQLGTYEPTGACIDGESVIHAVTGDNPTALDKTLLGVNIVGLETGYYTVAEVEAFFDKVEDYLDGDVSYTELADLINADLAKVRTYAGVGMIVLGTDFATIVSTGGSTLISDCDKQLIKAHIDNQWPIDTIYTLLGGD
jgi:hypothetical protein